MKIEVVYFSETSVNKLHGVKVVSLVVTAARTSNVSW
jgi:hypothetical protein